MSIAERSVLPSGQFDIEAALCAVESVIGDAKRPVQLHEPRFGGKERDYVNETIDSGWVSSVGKFVDRFEQELAERCGVLHAIATVNGTAALHAAMLLAGVKQDDEVLLPALTFIATANAAAYCGAHPHFCDSDSATLGIDPAKLDAGLAETAEIVQGACRNKKTGRRIAAIVPMHTFGHPVDMDALCEVAARWNVPVIEDAAEALGSVYKGRHVGRHGIIATLSFNGNKPVTTGGGGALLTNDATLARAAKHLTTTAKQPHAWAFIHDRVGYNYRLPNINAALGCAQLEQLDRFVEAKRRLAARYQEAFTRVPGASVFRDADAAQSNYWLVAMLLDRADETVRDAFLQASHDRGIICRPVWTGMHRLPMYRDSPRMNLDEAERLELRIVNLPSSMALELDRKK